MDLPSKLLKEKLVLLSLFFISFNFLEKMVQ